MTPMKMRDVVIDVTARNRADVGTPSAERSQMNAQGQSPVLRGILVVFSLEISSPFVSVERFEVNKIEVLNLDR